MANDTVFTLFVYGSLRSGFQSHAYEYISRYFTLVGPARVKGRMFDMGEFPAAVPTEADNWITGELYQVKNVTEFSWAMGQLDDYEGVHTEADEEPQYYRAITTVYHNGMDLHAWIYWFGGDTTGRPLIESGDMLQYMQQKK